MKSNSALVVCSGGLDSTVALYSAKEMFDNVEVVTFNYGSHHNEMEYLHLKKTLCELDIGHTRIDLMFIHDYFKSSLLDGEIPKGNYNDENMKSTVVPFRNGIMLSIATGLADSKGIGHVIIGNHSGDHFIYPDCRPSFIKAMDNAATAGTNNSVRILSPFCNMNKAEIVAFGHKLGVNFKNTYSCYNGRVKHCGECGTCRERKEAFELAGIKDTTEYEV